MNLESAEWRIPAERMKGGREHRVPLSPASVETLEAMRDLHNPAGWCFPSPTRAGNPIAGTSMAKALKAIYGDRCTVHGFRSSFRDWASEQTNVPHAVPRRHWRTRWEAPWSGPMPGRTSSRSAVA